MNRAIGTIGRLSMESVSGRLIFEGGMLLRVSWHYLAAVSAVFPLKSARARGRANEPGWMNGRDRESFEEEVQGRTLR